MCACLRVCVCLCVSFSVGAVCALASVHTVGAVKKQYTDARAAILSTAKHSTADRASVGCTFPHPGWRLMAFKAFESGATTGGSEKRHTNNPPQTRHASK